MTHLLIKAFGVENKMKIGGTTEKSLPFQRHRYYWGIALALL
jgi:hypothetical protein